jgi:CheY-like chemotaxis protein
MEGSQASVDILYVEDDEVDIQGMEREFKKVNSQIQIHIAQHGVQALNMLYGREGEEKIDPKIILLDINMPKMNGIDFLKEVRGNPEFGTIEVYILTGSYTTSDKVALRDLHVAGCIVKPLEYSDALNVFWALMHGNNL